MTVEFVVRVPPDTPPGEPIFLAGDGDALGNWRAAGVPLERYPDETFRVQLDLPADSRFLVTRGHWRRAETDADGREVHARQIHESRRTKIEVTVAGWGRGSVRYHVDFGSRFLPYARTLTIHLPPGYDLDPRRRFPVLYLHDGQNLFDANTAFAGVPWRADETAERLVRAGACRPAILVGVANSPDRIREYAGDMAANYARFLSEEVKPFIDKSYRTLPGASDTAVGGSSMGGLASLELCRRLPETFGLCAAMSPSLWWEDAGFLRSLGRDSSWLRSCRIWLDMGGREGATRGGQRANVRRARVLARMLARLGREAGRDFCYFEDPVGGHDEAAWGYRFDPMLRFLFPKE